MASSRPMRAIVRYTYQAEDSNQLSLRQVGDIITIHSRDNDDWWDGEFAGQRGYLPAAYVQLIEEAPSTSSSRARSSRHSSSAGMYLRSSTPTAAMDAAEPLLDEASAPQMVGGSAAAAAQQLWQGGVPASQQQLSMLANAAESTGLPSEPSFDASVFDGGFLSLGSDSSSPLTPASAPSKALFSLWSHQLALLTAVWAVVMGALALAMGLYDAFFGNMYIGVGAYSCILGFLTIVYELFFGTSRAAVRLPVRSICYLAVAAPLFIVYPTRIPAVLYVCVAGTNLIAAIRGERVVIRPRRRMMQQDGEGPVSPLPPASPGTDTSFPHGITPGGPSIGEQRVDPLASSGVAYNALAAPSASAAHTTPGLSSFWSESFHTFFLKRNTPGGGGVAYRGRRWTAFILLLLALLATFIVTAYLYARHYRNTPKRDVEDEDQPWNGWWVLGQVLTWTILACIVPFCFTIMKTFTRDAYDEAIRAGMPRIKTCWNTTIRAVLRALPPDPHSVFLFYHRVLSGLMMLTALGHAFAFSVSYMMQPEPTRRYYGLWSYASGALLLILLTIIYSTTRRHVRLVSLPLFRSVHSLGILFLLLLVVHAREGVSLMSGVAVLVPLAFWVLDAFLGWIRGARRQVAVTAVTHVRPSSMRLDCLIETDANWGARIAEGSWIYVNIPAVSGLVWLPVSISSPPQTIIDAGSADASQADNSHSLLDDPSQPLLSCFSIHLPVGGGMTSFGARSLEYFESQGPLGATSYTLQQPMREEQEEQLQQQDVTTFGRVHDTKGVRLLRVKGPYLSNLSHAIRYRTSMVVVPSSGIAGVASLLQCVVRYRWQRIVEGPDARTTHLLPHDSSFASSLPLPASPSFPSTSFAGGGAMYTSPDVLVIAWILDWTEIDEYRWMLQIIKDCEDELFSLRDASSNEVISPTASPMPSLLHKHLAFHIFVTNVPLEPAGTSGGHPVPQAAIMEPDTFFGASTINPPSGSGNGSGAGVGVGVGVGAVPGMGGITLPSPVRAPFTTLQLYRAIRNPGMGALASPTSSLSSSPSIMSAAIGMTPSPSFASGGASSLGDVHIHRGPAQLPDLFNALSLRAMGQSEIGVVYSAGAACMAATASSKEYMAAAGMAAVAPSRTLVESSMRMSAQLKEYCKHHEMQSGKVWRFHSDMEI